MTEELPSNQGRWGADDERGALNLITDEVRARAAREVRTGRWVSLALAIGPAPILSGPFVPSKVEESPVQQLMVHPVQPHPAVTASLDVLVVTNHHPRSTHLDAPAHIADHGVVYPGRPLAESVTPAGVHHGSSAAFSEGIVTRGVLLDLAEAGPLPEGHAVTAADLEAAERNHGVRVESGDALVVRCGWEFTPDPARASPGLSLDAVRWLDRRGVSVYAGDIGDAFPPLDPAVPFPLHAVALTRLGIPLVDAANVDDLAAACEELGRHSFLLVAAPPRITGTTGLPVNPVAVF
ncbi:cyclase family protein [Amycolatopsis rhabdoformis]|uniref:Cyclase family protein n=1 Tax=Amycolatopsis rhabdoformis TaxID=1448059 RepID=A0ABZ1I9Z7_9PSEU|nr:cyclase family protein [Amycolatopsis rhabdoformis]WSE30443.1 cyclase family protein [Amycolatopsis rhabdoformis]